MTDSDMMMEEREEFMISARGETPTSRTAHFLQPSIASTDSQLVAILPQRSTATEQPLMVTFRGWYNPNKNWGEWVESMRSSHESAWKEAGIYEAVLNSTYRIHRRDDLILALARKWCPETKTFVFPWGEATLTLEDMIILGGFSVTGCSVHPGLLNPVRDSSETEDIKQKLLKARLEFNKTTARKATHNAWVAKFMDSGCEIEHEAFLVLWLERFVFPISPRDTIGTKLFKVAIRLAQGHKMALVPAVLASIYQNLTSIKDALFNPNTSASITMILAPFQLVQVWVWERFPALRPNPNPIGHDHPRFARWDESKTVVEDLSLAIDFAGDDFCWRPYVLGAKHSELYQEQERWILVSDGCLGKELEALIWCWRVSELVGLENCIEQYLPHRVAMQFGMDQDIPGHVARANGSPQIAWNFYTRPVLDTKLYVPPQLFASYVTARYLQWWQNGSHVNNYPNLDDRIVRFKKFVVFMRQKSDQ